jgi:TRAP-type C4-dicarboxylate transport system permease large subunit
MIIEMHRIATTPILVAIPLFTFAGYLLSESGAPRRLIRLTDALLGWLPGGLSIIVLVTCAATTALTGATGITIIALGGILYLGANGKNSEAKEQEKKEEKVAKPEKAGEEKRRLD